ncbi:MAG: uncharacterized protein H6Q10_1198 [Acidobacteria bacterium]|nr:uncharacterized protein [Acidobacteriota bacterium]
MNRTHARARAPVAVLFLLAAVMSVEPAGTQSPPEPVPGIHEAAKNGDLQRVQALVAADPALVHAESQPNRKAPLHYAAEAGRLEVVRFLLDQGAQVSRPNIAGETPLHYAVALDSPDVVNLLLARGADVDARTEDGATPLRMAVAWGQPASIKALVARGAHVRDVLPNGETLLHGAALVGPAEAIHVLAAAGAPVNAVTDAGVTPLLAACAAGNVETAAALMARGADPNLRDASGRQPLTLAARAGDEGLVKRMLEAGARPVAGSTSDRRSALHVAAAAGYGSIVRLLLAAGADPEAKDSQGLTPLALAVRHGNGRAADALGGGRGHAGASGTTSPARGLLARPPRTGEATVWYLGHSGWAVRTARRLLVFDYAPNGRLPDDPSLDNGLLVPAEIRGLPITVFITHGHPDHYAPAVFDLGRDAGPVTYVSGFRPEGKDGYVEMAPRETKALGDMEVTAVRSTDAGVGFHVRADGVAIFHGGDLCNRAGEASPPFTEEIDFLAAAGLRADLYFAAVRGCGQPAGIRNGVYYAIARLSPRAVFPMHGGGREGAYAEFARAAADAGVRAPVHCAEFGGDRFTVAAGAPQPAAAPAAAARAAAAPPAAAPSADLGELLRRAGERIVREAHESTVVLADEVCRQRAFKQLPLDTPAGRMLLSGGDTVRTAQRRWKAEMARVRLPDLGQPAVPWMEIRDIVEVDGTPLPDREARLQRMLHADSAWTAKRAKEVLEDNARFNVGPVRRTINMPTIPLLVLHPLNQPRFAFDKVGEQRMDGRPAWKIAFHEIRRPTLIRASDSGIDMPSAGTFWIRPATGEVARAELQCGPRAESQLTVAYRQHADYGLSLPVEMAEKALGDDSQWVESSCTYSNARRFETSARLVIPK